MLWVLHCELHDSGPGPGGEQGGSAGLVSVCVAAPWSPSGLQSLAPISASCAAIRFPRKSLPLGLMGVLHAPS